MDIQYNRTEGVKTVVKHQLLDGTSDDIDANLLDLDEDSNVETTVIFLPNVWSLMPTNVEYQKIAEAYKNYIENPPVEEEEVEEKPAVVAKVEESGESQNEATAKPTPQVDVEPSIVTTSDSQKKAHTFPLY